MASRYAILPRSSIEVIHLPFHDPTHSREHFHLVGRLVTIVENVPPRDPNDDDEDEEDEEDEDRHEEPAK